MNFWHLPRVSTHGVKSPSCCFSEIGHWQVANKLFFVPPVSVSGAQSWKNDAIPPKWFNSLDTNSTFTVWTVEMCSMLWYHWCQDNLGQRSHVFEFYRLLLASISRTLYVHHFPPFQSCLSALQSNQSSSSSLRLDHLSNHGLQN